MKRKLSVILALLVIASMIALPASAQTGAPQAQPGRQAPAGLQPVTAADVDGPLTSGSYVPGKQRVTETARYVVQLADAPLAQQWLDGQQRGASFDAAAAQAYSAALLAQQAQVSAAVDALGGKTLANFTKLINGVAVEISGAQVRDLYFIPGVVSVGTARVHQDPPALPHRRGSGREARHRKPRAAADRGAVLHHVDHVECLPHRPIGWGSRWTPTLPSTLPLHTRTTAQMSGSLRRSQRTTRWTATIILAGRRQLSWPVL